MTYFICCTLTKAACVFIVKVIKERRNPTIVLVFQMLRLCRNTTTSFHKSVVVQNVPVAHAHAITSGNSSLLLHKCDFVRAHILLWRAGNASLCLLCCPV